LRPRNPLQASRDESLNFLLWLTLEPPLFTFLLSLAAGLGARDMWGTPMWNLTGLVIVQATASGRDLVSGYRLGLCLSVLFVIGLGGYLLANVFVPEWENKPSRIQWPARELSESFSETWRNREHTPLGIVAADGWLGGLIAMDARPRPSVWIDASFVKSPWITSARVAQEGALVVWRVRDGSGPPSALARTPGLRVLGVKSFGWPSTPRAQPLRVGYGLVRPGGAGR
jgi:hypothetical protein